MKKLVCFVLLIVLSLSIIGCGNGKDGSGNFYRITFRQSPYADIVITVDEGGSLSSDELPTIRQKTGYNVTWQTTEFTNVSQDLLVEAVYVPKTYTILYNTNGGSDITTSTSVTFDELYKLETNTKRENLYFGGWYYNGTVINNNGIWSLDASTPVIVTARWNYKITFIAEIVDGEVYDETNVFVEVGKRIKDENIPKVPHRQGYVGYWDFKEEDYDKITENATIYAKYVDAWTENH